MSVTLQAAARTPALPGAQPQACRSCGAPLSVPFVDLGMSPPSQSHVEPAQLSAMERFFPLRAHVCSRCFLVQVEDCLTPEELFSEYAYFSSYSSSWVEHARRYAHDAIERFALGKLSRVVEVASNDGYLLRHFAERGVPVLGIEPAANVAQVAIARGIPTVVRFVGRASAASIVEEHGRADLLVGNNVLAHVPDLNDFVAGLATLLAPQGVLTMEFPHLQRLMEQNQFDTIYHEHFSYFSFVVAERVFAQHGLTLFDVEELPTHGGSLRICACHRAHARPVARAVGELRERETADGFLTLDRYAGFDAQVRGVKRALLAFLIEAKSQGRSIAGYGAPGKGNTLLNYCGIRTDFLDFTVDANPYKQGKYTPGTRIPIRAPSALREARPDYVLILPWNLADEITRAHAYVAEWGGRFVVPIPQVRVLG